jgi:hypothetical protein
MKAPNHLRLTLIDSGYINPKARTTNVHLQTVEPLKVVDLFEAKSFSIANPSAVLVGVPCGRFRFIDIEMKEPFKPALRTAKAGPRPSSCRSGASRSNCFDTLYHEQPR